MVCTKESTTHWARTSLWVLQWQELDCRRRSQSFTSSQEETFKTRWFLKKEKKKWRFSSFFTFLKEAKDWLSHLQCSSFSPLFLSKSLSWYSLSLFLFVVFFFFHPRNNIQRVRCSEPHRAHWLFLALACVRMCDLRLVDWANFLLQPSKGQT